MTADVNCEFFKKGCCLSVMENAEAKEVRKINCSNDNQEACCYVCSYYNGCEISCNFLGENKNAPNISEESNKEFLRCPLCKSRMISSKVKLRVGGWSGMYRLLPYGDLGELGEEVLPVVLYVCPRCGKLEFMLDKKTKQKLINEV